MKMLPKERASLDTLMALACILTAGCVHVDIRLDQLMPADRGPRTALLPAGYATENRILLHQGETIGITHSQREGNRIVILYCGGTVFRRSTEGGVALQALALGADVVLFDYPGHGDSSGPPGAAAILDAATAVYDDTLGRAVARGKKLVLYGFSMGGVVAAHLARRRAADGIVLEATVPNVRDWARARAPFPLRPLLRLDIEPQLDELDSVAALEQFPGKVLLLSGTADELAPTALSAMMLRRLEAAHREVRHIRLSGMRHGQIMLSPEFPAIARRFLDGL
jgi:pimeloyl-ACP methyl ester carboxylesterase